MNVLILEDKSPTRLMLEKIVRSCKGAGEVYSCSNRQEALLKAADHHVDLFLVDIILEPRKANDNSGIDFVDTIRKQDEYRMTPVIFITVLAGLERELLKKVHCYDYIEKPLGDGKMAKARIEEALEAISVTQKPDLREQISLHYDGIGYLVYVDEVMFFENKHGVLYIYLRDDSIVIPHLSAKKFMEGIKRTKFMVPVYGTFINPDYIDSVDFRNKEVYMKDGTVIPIGGRKYKDFKEDYLHWNGKK